MNGDPRLTLARPDLAAAALEGLARAERFVEPVAMQTAVAAASLRMEPRVGAEQADQLLLGEVFDVLETANGFAWGQARRDGYVGYVAVMDLGDQVRAPTHWISALRAFAHAEPAIRSPARGPYSLNALVAVTELRDRFALAAGVGWLPAIHLTPIGQTLTDPAGVVERFMGTPYLWGGRDSLGLDCSGLVQQALYACGRACPRDTDQQAQLGAPAPAASLIRGDLVFWAGHVGMMLDAERLAHANAHHMAVAVEALSEAVARIGAPTVFRRL